MAYINDCEKYKISQFIHKFYHTYDNNRDTLHTLFSENINIKLVNRHMKININSNSNIQGTIANLPVTKHKIYGITVQKLYNHIPNALALYKVLCYGNIKYKDYKHIKTFKGIFIIFHEISDHFFAISLLQTYKKKKKL